MKKILIPTDFSDNAKHALAYAIEFERNSDSTIHLVHVVTPILVESPNAAILNSILLEETKNIAQKKMSALKRYAKERMEGGIPAESRIETSIVVGVPIYEINEKASELAADLIIMGTQGVKHNRLQKIFGTVSKSLINRTPCPVLLVPFDYKYKEIENIVFASNLKSQESDYLNRALDLLNPFEPNVRCLHVSNDDIYELDISDTAQHLVDNSTAKNTIFNVEYERKRIEAFEEYADQYKVEMVVMQRSKMNLLSKLIRKNLPNKLVDRLHIPLLVLNDTQN